MARFDRLRVLLSILDTGLLPMFDSEDIDVAERVVNACVAGGARAIEFRNRGEQGVLTFAELVSRIARAEGKAILGAGSIVDASTAALYIGCGANFIGGPILNSDVARLCNRHKVAYLPGCATATEISTAEELGVEICKIFPGAELGGPSFVKAIRGPLPWSSLMPTGGVDATEDSVRSWIQAGSACLGMSSRLIGSELQSDGDFTALTARVAQVLEWVRLARAS
jgi:2-dehydro-3-deoxyphosphogluconate aldolase/(4S)-4-hydroxy-2-oxoglutarate aldolase